MNTSYGTTAGGPGPADIPAPSSAARKKRRFRWSAGLVLAGFLVGGGIAWAATSGSPAANAAGNPQAAAVLNAALNTASSTSSAVPAARVRWALGRLRRLAALTVRSPSTARRVSARSRSNAARSSR